MQARTIATSEGTACNSIVRSTIVWCQQQDHKQFACCVLAQTPMYTSIIGLGSKMLVLIWFWEPDSIIVVCMDPLRSVRTSHSQKSLLQVAAQESIENAAADHLLQNIRHEAFRVGGLGLRV